MGNFIQIKFPILFYITLIINTLKFKNTRKVFQIRKSKETSSQIICQSKLDSLTLLSNKAHRLECTKQRDNLSLSIYNKSNKK
jgi:hypothetical protein